MKVLVIDPKIAGISGDMLIAALVDLTGSADLLEPVADAIRGLSSCDHFSFEVHDVDAGGISAKKIKVEVREKNHRNHEDMQDSIGEIAKKTGLSDTAKNLAFRIIDALLSADAKLHRSAFHHHEMSSVDTLFDVAGSLTLLDHHGFLEGEIFGTPPVLGSGFTRITGGEIACPAPATLEILCRHQFPYSSYPADRELTTPTGSCNFGKYHRQDRGCISPYEASAGWVWNRFSCTSGQASCPPGCRRNEFRCDPGPDHHAGDKPRRRSRRDCRIHRRKAP